MKRSKILFIRIICISLFAGILFSGCEFKEIELISVEQFDINSMSQGKMQGTLTVKLTNPNFFPITVKSGKLDISANHAELGSATLDKPFKINGNSTEIYKIELTGTFGNLLSTGLAGLAGMLTGREPELQVVGTFDAGNFLRTRTIPVDVTSRVPISL